jgi:hypothetical protein
MSPPFANAITCPSHFEFEALKWAERYRQAIIEEFAPFLQGAVVEIGAGVGQNTPWLRQLPRVEQVTSVEPEPAFCAEFRRNFPDLPLIEGTSESLKDGSKCAGIVSINVLEHIEDDPGELARYHQLLRSDEGRLCLLVPARQEIYSPLDRDFGHYRRYARVDLKKKVEAAGFRLLKLKYFNFFGYFAWWFGFRLLRKRRFNPAAVRLYDRFIFPVTLLLERHLISPPLGQSLIAIAEAA